MIIASAPTEFFFLFFVLVFLKEVVHIGSPDKGYHKTTEGLAQPSPSKIVNG